MGKLANWWLMENVGAIQIRGRDATSITGAASEQDFLRLVNIGLAKAHAASVAAEQQGIPGLLSANQISEYHEVYFQSLGLPPETFGGSGAGFRTDYWCDSCDSEPCC